MPCREKTDSVMTRPKRARHRHQKYRHDRRQYRAERVPDDARARKSARSRHQREVLVHRAHHEVAHVERPAAEAHQREREHRQRHVPNIVRRERESALGRGTESVPRSGKTGSARANIISSTSCTKNPGKDEVRALARSTSFSANFPRLTAALTRATCRAARK